MNGGY